jgi:hypothetical protein
MTDRFTEVSSQGFFSRLFGSVIGFFFGPLLVIAAVFLLSWNEGRAVQAIRGLGEATQVAVEANTNSVSPANEGKLVHAVGSATAAQPIADSDLGLSFSGEVAVARDASMYQWRENKKEETHDKLGGGQETVTTYTYEKIWSDTAIASSDFRHPEGHSNPPMPFASAQLAASDAKLGGFTLDADTLKLVDLSDALHPTAPSGWSMSQGALYKGNPDAPQVGNMKVAYRGLASGSTISVLAAQSHSGFAPFVTSNGYQLRMAEAGNHPLAEMIAQKKGQESMFTWLLRGAGFVVMFIGAFLFLRPLSTVASVIPLLGSIVGAAAGLAAFAVASPATLVVIAISWIAFRPLIGGGLLVLAAASLYLLRRWHQSAHPVPRAATT